MDIVSASQPNAVRLADDHLAKAQRNELFRPLAQMRADSIALGNKLGEAADSLSRLRHIASPGSVSGDPGHARRLRREFRECINAEAAVPTDTSLPDAIFAQGLNLLATVAKLEPTNEHAILQESKNVISVTKNSVSANGSEFQASVLRKICSTKSPLPKLAFHEKYIRRAQADLVNLSEKTNVLATDILRKPELLGANCSQIQGELKQFLFKQVFPTTSIANAALFTPAELLVKAEREN